MTASKKKSKWLLWTKNLFIHIIVSDVTLRK